MLILFIQRPFVLALLGGVALGVVRVGVFHVKHLYFFALREGWSGVEAFGVVFVEGAED